MKETIIQNQWQIWWATAFIFSLVSLRRKTIYPLIGFLLYTSTFLLFNNKIGGSDFGFFFKNLLFMAVGISFFVGQGFVFDSLKSKHLNPRDELNLIIIGIFFYLPGILFFAFFYIDSKASFIIYPGIFGVIMLFFSKRADRLIDDNESGYLEIMNDRIQRTRLVNLKSVLGDVGLLEMRRAVEQAYEKGELDEFRFNQAIIEIHFLNGDYEGAIKHYEKQKKSFDGTNDVFVRYCLALAEEKLGNIDAALSYYEDVNEKTGGYIYYVRHKIENLKPITNDNKN